MNKITSDTSTKFFIVAIGLILIAAVMKELAYIFIPFVIAYFIYFLFAPLNNALYDKKIPGFLIIMLDILIIGFLAFGISRILIESVLLFTSDLNAYADKLNVIVKSVSVSLNVKDPYFRSFSIQKIIAKLDYKALAGGIFTSAFSVGGSIFLVIFFFVFIVTGHHAIYVAFKRRYQKSALTRTDVTKTSDLPSSEASASQVTPEIPTQINLESTTQEITSQIQRYVIAKIAINLFAGIFVGLATWILGVDFPVIWGILTFFLNFIPTIGSAIVFLFPTLMALIQRESLGFAALTAGVMIVVQTAFFNFLEPLLIGKRLDLNPIIILLSVLFWGYIWGIPGMFIGVPLTAIIKIILSNSRNENLKFIVDLMSQD